MRIHTSFIPWAAWLLTGSLGAQAPHPEKEKKGLEVEIPKYLELDARVGTGGQPTDEGLRQLSQKGYKVIINLRTPNEGVDLSAEEKRARELGLQYFNIPVVSTAPQEEQAWEFLKLMEELKKEQVFVHCASANRVGSFMMIQRAVKEGVSVEQAENEADRIGLRSETLRRFSRDFIEKSKRR